MHHNINFLWFLKKKALSELYLAITLRGLAISMVGIFIPLYLYFELAFPLKDVFVFYIITSIIFAIFTPIAAKFSSKVGFKYCILISSFFHITFFGLLFLLNKLHYSLILLAIILGISEAFFWFSFHADFAKNSDHSHRGREVSLWFAFSSVSAILGPFIGGLILSIPELGFGWLFIFASIVLLSSAVPLFFFKEDKTRPISFKNIFSKIKLKEAIAFIGNGMEGIAATVLWPLFIFIIIKKYFLMGSLASIVAIFMIIFTVGVGKLTDGIKKRKIMKIGIIISTFTWLIRIFVKTISQVFTVTSIGAAGSTLTNIPFSAITYDKIKKNNLIEFLVLREIFLCFGRILVLTAMYFTSKWFVGFFMAGIGSLLHLLF